MSESQLQQQDFLSLTPKRWPFGVSNFAVCLLTSGEQWPSEVCGVTAVRLKERAIITNPNKEFFYLEGFAATFLCVFAPEHSFDGIHTADTLKQPVLSQFECLAPCTYLAEFGKMFSYLNKARNMIRFHRKLSRLIASPHSCH